MSWMWSQLRFFSLFKWDGARRDCAIDRIISFKVISLGFDVQAITHEPHMFQGRSVTSGILQKKVFLFHLFMCPVIIKAANSGWFWLNNWRMKPLNGSAGLNLNQGVHFPTIHLFTHSASPEGNANNMGPHLIAPSASLCNYQGSLS